MKILVTGANGQLGQCLRDIIEKSNNRKYKWFWTDVVETDREVDTLDITDVDAVRKYVKKNKIDTVVNCAAATNVDGVEDNVEFARLLNITAVKNLASICEEYDARLIHISTDFVFGDDKCSPYTPEDETNPLSVYGKTKLAGEAEIKESGCKYVIIRTAWLYSKYGNNFLKTMTKLMDTKKEIKVVNDQIGTPTYAPDLADIIYTAVRREKISGVYHFTNEGVCSWYDFACMIRSCVVRNTEVIGITTDEYYKDGKPHAVRPHYSVLDKSKTKTDFDYEPVWWAERVLQCVNELSKNNN